MFRWWFQALDDGFKLLIRILAPKVDDDEEYDDGDDFDVWEYGLRLLHGWFVFLLCDSWAGNDGGVQENGEKRMCVCSRERVRWNGEWSEKWVVREYVCLSREFKWGLKGVRDI
jgi:hypothetical protein